MAVIYKMADVYTLATKFREKFIVVTTLEEGDKLTVDEEGSLKKDEDLAIVQTFTRWWRQQSRYRVVEILEKECNEYGAFLKFVYGAFKSPSCRAVDKKQLCSIYKQHIALVAKVIEGLSKMKITYNNTIDIELKLEEIIRHLKYLP